MTPIDRNCANLQASLSFYGPVSKTSGVVLITSPVRYAVFNIALLESPVSLSNGEFERRLTVARDHFEAAGRSWSFWICEDWVPHRVQRRLPDIFEHHGMGCIAESPGMQIDDLSQPRRPLPSLECRRVNDQATRSDFIHLISQCFHVPGGVAREIYDREGIWDSPLVAWLGYHEGRAIASAATVCADGALGVYSVATLPAWRRRGFAESIMRHAVDEARDEGVDGPIVLQSSSFGLKLYRELGFKRTTRFFVYATA